MKDLERLIRQITIEEAKRKLPQDDEAIKILELLDQRGPKPLDQKLSLSEALYRATDQQKEVIINSVNRYFFLFLQ